MAVTATPIDVLDAWSNVPGAMPMKDAWAYEGDASDHPEAGTQVRRIAPDASRPALSKTAELPSPTAMRTAALEFMSGSLRRWTIHELVAWLDLYMIRPGRLRLRDPFPIMTITETGVGTLVYGPRGAKTVSGPLVPQADAGRLVRTARQKVAGTLGAFLAPTPDDRFVQSALYEGRVTRMPGRGRGLGWGVMVWENVSLSDQVLALFVGDLLTHREDYDNDLVVCEVCGTVEFWPSRCTPQGCRAHPEGLVGVPTLRGGR